MSLPLALNAAESVKRSFSLPSDSAEKSLKLYSEQSGRALIMSAAAVEGIRTNEVRGEFTAREALDRMLAGTGLEVVEDARSGSLAVRKAADPNGSRAAPVTPSVRPNPSRNQTTDDSAPIELSPFEVRADNNVGYLAGNTLAGSRLDTSLKDTPASISVMTEEFLADIGALSVEDAMAYANNLQVDQEETVVNMTGNLIAENFPTYRMRGMKATVARNYFSWNLPGSTYNIERIDESRGPNSVLFGIGSAGGIINTSTKQALLARRRETVSLAAGSFDTYRATLDLNEPLVKDKLGMRLNALWGRQNTSREYSESMDRRVHATGLWLPFPQTRVRAEFERGATRDHVTRPWTMQDQISLWNERGRPVRATLVAAAADGIARLNTNTARVTWVENNDYFADLRGVLASTVPTTQQNTMIVDRSVVDYSVNPAGPGAQRDTRFSNWMAGVEQKLPARTFLSLAFNHQAYNFVGYDPGEGTSNTLSGDPNQFLPTGPTATQTNPFAGRYYVETNWYRRDRSEEFNTLRAALANEFDLGRWGQYRWAALVEHERSNIQRDERRESWIGSPFNVQPENNANQVWRRYYLSEGQWSTYRVPAANGPLIVNRTDPVTGRTLSSKWLQRNTNIDDDSARLDTRLIGGQAAFFQRRLIGTFGYRRDKVRIEDRGTMRDPVTQEYIVDYSTVARSSDNAQTRTLGAVCHVMPALSFTYNRSNNNALPNNAHRVLPDSARPAAGEGRGEDIGAGMDLFDGRVNFRGSYFTTSGRQETDYRSIITLVTNRNIRILNALVNAGQVSAAEADAHQVNSNGGYSDRESKGWEFRVIANPSSNWRLQANYSITDAIESNIIPEVRAWAEENIAFWSRHDTAILTTSNIAIAQEIANLRDDIAAQTSAQGLGAIGNRRHKTNLFVRHDFAGGLKGFYAGGGWRYQSKMLTGRNLATNLLQYSDAIIRTDLLLGCRFKLPRANRARAHVQLNISNVFDDDDPMILRRTPDDLYVRRFSVVEPRTFRLTATFEF